MIDLKLTETDGIYDISYGDDGDFEMEDGFDTAILMSLFCERRALKDEVPDAIRRRGWVGNAFYNPGGFENGSKMWIHTEQGRVTNVVLNAIKNTSVSGLYWMTLDNIAKSVESNIEVISGVPNLKLKIEYSPSKVEEKFFSVWENTGT